MISLISAVLKFKFQDASQPLIPHLYSFSSLPLPSQLNSSKHHCIQFQLVSNHNIKNPNLYSVHVIFETLFVQTFLQYKIISQKAWFPCACFYSKNSNWFNWHVFRMVVQQNNFAKQEISQLKSFSIFFHLLV